MRCGLRLLGSKDEELALMKLWLGRGREGAGRMRPQPEWGASPHPPVSAAAQQSIIAACTGNLLPCSNSHKPVSMVS